MVFGVITNDYARRDDMVVLRYQGVVAAGTKKRDRTERYF